MILRTTAPLETVRVAEAIAAWRAWSLWSRRDGSRLRLRPVAGLGRPWPPLRPAEATCGAVRLHAAPNPHCSCGLHGLRTPELVRRARDPAVVGTVALWGRVIEHDFGYRAQYGYPQRLRLACPFCLWQRGVGAGQPEVVAQVRRGRLVPLCGQHLALARRLGMAARRLFPAGPLQQELLSTYAVDLLAPWAPSVPGAHAG